MVSVSLAGIALSWLMVLVMGVMAYDLCCHVVNSTRWLFQKFQDQPEDETKN